MKEEAEIKNRDHLFKPGNPGRPKGAKNKIPTSLAGKVLHACEQLEKIGKPLSVEAEGDPKWFYETFVKAMLPKDFKFSGDDENPLRIIIEKVRPRRGDLSPGKGRGKEV